MEESSFTKMQHPRPTRSRTLVVVPNWDGEAGLVACLDALLAQSTPADVMVVDNGSTDGSVALITTHYPNVHLVRHSVNLGYTGGVNPGFHYGIRHGYTYVAPFNNDAVADSNWLRHLEACLDADERIGIATCKILSADGTHLDSTGDYYTTWGLPYPRGRGESSINRYDDSTVVFGASGGASLYRVRMLKDVGLLDEDFFAYYEDVDLSFRAQLAGWKIAYVPDSTVRHEMSVTGRRIKGFFTYQTMKNLPILFIKNVPFRLMPTIAPRFFLVYVSFFISAMQRHQLGYALRGYGRFLVLLPKKIVLRQQIQRSRSVDTTYIRFILHWDLPPNADRWRAVRTRWWKLVGKS